MQDQNDTNIHKQFTTPVIAGIDAGSNALRILIRRYNPDGSWEIVQKKRFPVRLGRGVFSTGLLDEQTIEQAVGAFKQMKDLIGKESLTLVRAVATSAVREGKNRDELIDAIWNSSGIKLEVISGAEEARLVYLAVREKLGYIDDNWVIVDLGGGSVEVTHVSKDMLFSETKAYGTVRLLEEVDENATTDERITILEDHINNMRLDPYFHNLRHTGLIGTGGNIEEIARITGRQHESGQTSILHLSDLENLIESLKSMTYQERIQKYGIREDRADVILPAAMVYRAICKKLGDPEILVPGVGVRDGIVIDLYKKLTSKTTASDYLHPRLDESIEVMGRKFGFDENHARFVTKIADSIFTQVRSSMALDESDRDLLKTASMLHDIGQYISYERHHKHSFYIISNSELPGFDKQQMLLIANIARYHRRSEPKPEHSGFAALSSIEQTKVKMLGSILRLADALDSEHLQRISNFNIDIGDSEILLEFDPGQGMSETLKLAKKGQMLEKILAKRLVVKETNNDKK